MLAAAQPYPQYFDLDGSPLDGGAIYYGEPNQDPQSAPLTVYWDAAGTQPAAQPIATLNGFPVRSGTPAAVYVSGDYSLRVRNKQAAQVLHVPSAADASQSLSTQLALSSSAAGKGAALVAARHKVTGALACTVADFAGSLTVDVVRDFGAGPSKTGAQNAAAFTAALNSGARTVRVPAGTYQIAGHLTIAAAGLGIRLVGEDMQNTVLSWQIDSGTADKFAFLLDAFVTIERLTLQNTGTDLTASGALVSYTPTTENGMRNCHFRRMRIKGFGAGVGATVDGSGLSMARSQVFSCEFSSIEFDGCGIPIRLGAGVNNNVWNKVAFLHNKGSRHIYLIEGSSNLFISPQFEPVDASVTSGFLNAELVRSPNNIFQNAYLEPCYGFLADSSPGTVIDAPIVEGFNWTIGTLSNSSILRSTNSSNTGVYASPMVSRVSLPVCRASSNPVSYCASDDNTATLTLVDSLTSRDSNFKLRPASQTGALAVTYRGEWLPSITGTSGTNAHTYDQRQGWYVRVGNMVTVFWRVSLTAKDAGMGGNATITGLPFLSMTATLFSSSATLSQYRADLTSGYSELSGEIGSNSAVIVLSQSGDNVPPLALPASGVLATSVFVGSMTYITEVP